MKIYSLILSIIIFSAPSLAWSSPLSKLFSDALAGVVESAPIFSSKALQKGIQNQTQEEKRIENELTSKLKGIDEKTGKMANSITNLIFAFNTNGQAIISKNEYERIHGEFKKTNFT